MLEQTTTVDILEAISDLSSHIDEQFIQFEKKFDDKLFQSEHRLKDYIDRKLSDHTAEMFKRLDEKYTKEKQFREKILELFKKHHIGTPEDLAFLDGLAKGL